MVVEKRMERPHPFWAVRRREAERDTCNGPVGAAGRKAGDECGLGGQSRAGFFAAEVRPQIQFETHVEGSQGGHLCPRECRYPLPLEGSRTGDSEGLLVHRGRRIERFKSEVHPEETECASDLGERLALGHFVLQDEDLVPTE